MIHVATWNVAEQGPPINFDSWLGLTGETAPELMAVGLQEMADETQWSNRILSFLTSKGYVRIKTRTLGWLLTQVFVKRTKLLDVSNVESESTKTGFGGLIANKGGVSIRLDYCGVNLIFVNCHLTAHDPKVKERIEDYMDILDAQKFRDSDVDFILDHDYVFWMGDLNFRIDDLDKTEIEHRVKKGELQTMWPHDQLNKSRKEEIIFVDFEEGPLNFDPTYKYDIGTDDYDSSEKQRKPAWTDRILWMTHEDSFKDVTLSAQQLYYRNYQEYKNSDHKPVSAGFEIKVLNESPSMPVQFTTVCDWKPGQDNEANYSVSGDLEVSTWDWIGLYRSDFKHPEDHLTYEWAKPQEKNDESEIKFGGSYTAKLTGRFVLAYFNRKKNYLVGYSNEFDI
ncbi:phosphatidylinositol 4,5-bisphosphate 5-phosphatase A-like isoform X2 [Lineus longissimus]|uniref:phosphatidylinositol 4,5-bisphosphate 5-phosphatase A-like isoform X2 n=1 Tax=Lineus longissimus TaxID=88925 RepID=UPI00315DD0D0